MAELLGRLLPLALVIAFSPVPVLTLLLLLLTSRVPGRGAGFLAGWTLGVAAVSAACLLLAYGAGLRAPETGGSSAGAWMTLAVGMGLLSLAGVQWVFRSRDPQKRTPGWMRAISRISPFGALVIGLLSAIVNPKNLAVFATTAVLIAESGMGAAVPMTFFVVVTISGVGVLAGVHALASTRLHGALERLRTWLENNSAQAVSGTLTVAGVVLAASGTFGLVA